MGLLGLLGESNSNPNLLTNGDFAANLNGWTLTQTAGASVPEWDAGVAKLLSNNGAGFSRMDQSFTTDPGIEYTLQFDYVSPGSGSVQVTAGITQGGSTLGSVSVNTTGTHTLNFSAPGYLAWIRFSSGVGGAQTIDNVTVRRRIITRTLRRTTMSATSGGTWGPRDGAWLTFLGNDLYLVGGWSGAPYDSDWPDSSQPTTNQVYKSTNFGNSWSLIKQHANTPDATHFSQRHWFSGLVYDNKMWLINGDSGLTNNGAINSDIRNSSDGVSWPRVGANSMITNGTFDSNTTGWTAGTNNTLAWQSAGRLRSTSSVNDGAFFGQSVSVVNGTTYSFEWDSVDLGGQSQIAIPYLGTSLGSSNRYNGGSFGPWGFGTKTFTYTATATETIVLWFYAGVSKGVGNFLEMDNIKCFTRPGYHGTYAASCGELNDVFYLVGGHVGAATPATATNKVWKSVDFGATWTDEGSAPWAARGFAGPLVKHDGKLWLIAGGKYADAEVDRVYYNDVWSFDGTTWTEEKADGHSDFVGGFWPILVSYGGRLWLSTRYRTTNLESTVSSVDGVTWESTPLELPASHADGVAVHSTGIYVASGNWALQGSPQNSYSPTWRFR